MKGVFQDPERMPESRDQYQTLCALVFSCVYVHMIKSSLWVGLSERFTVITNNKTEQLQQRAMIKAVWLWGSQDPVPRAHPPCEVWSDRVPTWWSRVSDSGGWRGLRLPLTFCCHVRRGTVAPGQTGVAWATEPTESIAAAGGGTGLLWSACTCRTSALGSFPRG